MKAIYGRAATFVGEAVVDQKEAYKKPPLRVWFMSSAVGVGLTLDIIQKHSEADMFIPSVVLSSVWAGYYFYKGLNQWLYSDGAIEPQPFVPLQEDLLEPEDDSHILYLELSPAS